MSRLSIFTLLLLGVLTSVEIFGKGADEYTKALALYQGKEYKKAFPTIEKEAKRGNKEAQYIMAQMYENGEGVKKDLLQAVHWYKQAASKYAYVQQEYKPQTNMKRKVLLTG